MSESRATRESKPATSRVMVLRCPGLCADDVASGKEAADPAAEPGGDPAAEREAARAFERVIQAVTEFCPAVEAVEPGVCAFAARGPARYFGGEEVVAGKIIAAVADLGVECRIGVADGLFAARLAARENARHDARGNARHDTRGNARHENAHGNAITLVPAGTTGEFLGRQPVAVLADPELAGLLIRLGIRTLADLAALPVKDVANRFGAVGTAAHRLASGYDPRPVAVRQPAEDLSVAQEFDPPETSAEPLVFAAKTLAEQLHAGLAAKGLSCVRVQVYARWDDGRELSRLWRHDGLLTAVQVADRVRWQLDGWRAEPERAGPERAGPERAGPERAGPERAGPERAEPGNRTEIGGVVLLRLGPDQVVRATGQQLALWGEAVLTDRVARAAMRVQALLGHDAVLRPSLSGGRNVAEQVTQRAFWDKGEPRFPRDRPWPGQIPGAAPACVFPEPREAEVTDDAGQPVTVSGRCVVSGIPAALTVGGDAPREITGWAGPWPLTERWWEPDEVSRRARFQLVTDDGRAWLAAVRDGRWQIEGGYWLWAGTIRRFRGGNCRSE
jgi:protein ImuB